MNERIKELAEQTELNATLLFNKEKLEKFAELIVRECVEVCAGIAAVRAGYNDADSRDTAYSCGDMIKEHFGVEE